LTDIGTSINGRHPPARDREPTLAMLLRFQAGP
jgi:hypothetical protein